MIKLGASALLTLAMLFGPLGAAAADLKIGVVDPDAILASSAEGKRVQESIKKKAEELSRPLGTKRQDLGRQVEEFQKQAAVMKDEAKRAKAQELEKKMQEFDRQAAEADKQINQFKESQLAPLSRKMDQALEQISREEKLDLILYKAVVPYIGNKSLDITDKVRAKFGP